MLVLVQFLFKVISKSQIGDLWYEITSSTNKHTSLVLLIDILRGMLINVLRYLKEPLPKSSVIIKNCIIVGDLNVDLMKDETHYNTGE